MSYRVVFLLLVVACLTVGVYWQGLHGPFLFDDYGNIVNNAAIRIHDLESASLGGALSGPSAGPLGRPVSVLTFALSHYFHGLDPFGFKATNLLLHLVNGLLVFMLTEMILRSLGPSSGSRFPLLIPVILSALWLVHPINVVAVLLTVQRMTLLAATFGLLALIAHLKWLMSSDGKANWWFLWAWLVCWPLAVFSKETALTIPAIALVIGLTLPGVRRMPAATMLLGAGFVTAVLAVALMLGAGWLEQGYEARSFSLGQRLLTESRVLWFYVAQILLPRFELFGLFLDDIPLSQGVFFPVTTLFSILAWGGMVVLSVRLRRTLPLFSLGVGWFLAGHLLESTVVPLEIAFEHRNYIPSIGVLLAVFSLLHQLVVRRQIRVPGTVAGILLVALVVYCAALTFMRSAHFSDGLRFALMEVEYHPQSPRAHLVAATSLMDAGYGASSDFAGQAIIYHLLQAAKLDADHKQAYLYLLVFSCGMQRVPDSAWVNELEARLLRSPFVPQDGELPSRLLKLVVNAPGCLAGESVERLFRAGAANERVYPWVRARFLESLSDYMLLIQRDAARAKSLLQEAQVAFPGNVRIMTKLANFQGG